MRATVEYLQGRSRKTLRRFLAELRPNAGYSSSMSNEALARVIMGLPELRREGGVRLRMERGRLSIINPAPDPRADVGAAAAQVRRRKPALAIFLDGTFERKLGEVRRAMDGDE